MEVKEGKFQFGLNKIVSTDQDTIFRYNTATKELYVNLNNSWNVVSIRYLPEESSQSQ